MICSKVDHSIPSLPEASTKNNRKTVVAKGEVRFINMMELFVAKQRS